jgi:hypothetical protein
VVDATKLWLSPVRRQSKLEIIAPFTIVIAHRTASRIAAPAARPERRSTEWSTKLLVSKPWSPVYHFETNQQEDFLILMGECILLEYREGRGDAVVARVRPA